MVSVKVLFDGVPRDFKAVWMDGGVVKLIDQRELPAAFKVVDARNLGEVARAIRDMTVRGAPAIGVTAGYGIAQAALQGVELDDAARALRATRPTAYDLFHAIDVVKRGIEIGGEPVSTATRYSLGIEEECRMIGEHGAKLLKDGARVLTH